MLNIKESSNQNNYGKYSPKLNYLTDFKIKTTVGFVKLIGFYRVNQMNIKTSNRSGT